MDVFFSNNFRLLNGASQKHFFSAEFQRSLLVTVLIVGSKLMNRTFLNFNANNSSVSLFFKNSKMR
jgi:hypothetical protein